MCFYSFFRYVPSIQLDIDQLQNLKNIYLDYGIYYPGHVCGKNLAMSPADIANIVVFKYESKYR